MRNYRARHSAFNPKIRMAHRKHFFSIYSERNQSIAVEFLCMCVCGFELSAPFVRLFSCRFVILMILVCCGVKRRYERNTHLGQCISSYDTFSVYNTHNNQHMHTSIHKEHSTNIQTVSFTRRDSGTTFMNFD